MVPRVDPALTRFALLFLALYVAFGVASPFFPRFLSLRGLTAEEIGTVLASGTAIRLLAGPAAGRLADRFHALRAAWLATLGTGGYFALIGLVQMPR